MKFLNEPGEVDEELLSGFKRELADVDGKLWCIDLLDKHSHNAKLQIWCNDANKLKERLGVLAYDLLDLSDENEDEDFKHMFNLIIPVESAGYYGRENMTNLELDLYVKDEEPIGTVFNGLSTSMLGVMLQNISNGDTGVILYEGMYYYYDIGKNKSDLLHKYTEILRLPLSNEILESTELEKTLDFIGYMSYYLISENYESVNPSIVDMYKKEVENLSEEDRHKYTEISKKGVEDKYSWKILTFDKNSKEFIVGYME